MDIEQDQGYFTHTYDAIQSMREEFSLAYNGARDGVFKIGIVITDGRSYNTTATVEQARLAKEEGYHMFAIGIGFRKFTEGLQNEMF